MQTKHKIFGRVYVTDDALTCGDYGGAGSVGVANIREILAMEGVTDHVYHCAFRDIDDEFYSHRMSWETTTERDSVTEHVISHTPPIVMLATGEYGSQAIYILDIDTADETVIGTHAIELLADLRETIDALEDYPCIDDETVSAVEMAWEIEAFECWARDDLIRALDDDIQDRAEELGDDVLFECYREAMEINNEYPTPEYSGSYIPVDRIAGSFAASVAARL